MLAVLLALAVATSSWTLTPEPGTRIADGVSTEAVAFGGTTHLWVTAIGGMPAYTSTDGLTFARLGDALTPPGTDPAVVPLAHGGWRMYFVQRSPSGDKTIESAVSGDLVNWTVEPGVRLDLGSNPGAGVPEAVVLPDGRVRIYYVSGPGTIDSAVSSDGLAFEQEAGDRLTGGYVDPAVVQLADGSWLMVCSTDPGRQQRLFVATSQDGLAWTPAKTPLYAPAENVLDPTLVPLGGDRFRVYFSVSALGSSLDGPYHVESGVLAATPAKATPAKQTKKTKKTKKTKRHAAKKKP